MHVMLALAREMHVMLALAREHGMHVECTPVHMFFNIVHIHNN
jgi:hypothetical protein